MKPERNIFIAFILNLAFSLLEFISGIFTGSVAIISDSVHDIGDAAGIGISFALEKKSKKQPDRKYTYGYERFSLLGGLITTLILLVGSVFVVYNAVLRIIEPVKIDYNGMIIFAVIGFFVNLIAAIITKDGRSLNQKAINLHMLEDVLGWLVVLIGAVIMRFTDFYIIDSLMSVGVAIFIIVNAVKNLKEVLDVFLLKTPRNIDINEMEEHICKIDGVIGVHHIHIWTLNGQSNYATMHIVFNGDPKDVKNRVRGELQEHGVIHVTLELEGENEICQENHCHVNFDSSSRHHHHHHQ